MQFLGKVYQISQQWFTPRAFRHGVNVCPCLSLDELFRTQFTRNNVLKHVLTFFWTIRRIFFSSFGYFWIKGDDEMSGEKFCSILFCPKRFWHPYFITSCISSSVSDRKTNGEVQNIQRFYRAGQLFSVLYKYE